MIREMAYVVGMLSSRGSTSSPPKCKLIVNNSCGELRVKSGDRKGTIQVLRHHVFDFLDPPNYLFDDLQYYKSSKIAIFWTHQPTSLMT